MNDSAQESNRLYKRGIELLNSGQDKVAQELFAEARALRLHRKLAVTGSLPRPKARRAKK